MPKKKTPKKSPKCKSPISGQELVPGNPGNSGGKKGRSGRKPNEFKEKCAKVLAKPAVWKSIEEKAKAGDINFVKFLAHYSEGVPAKTVKLETDQPIAFTLNFHSTGRREAPAAHSKRQSAYTVIV
eukprot:GHVO01020781.1.p2 GENE.GHVO01020781.1~~GHVO01020781.1.p2  ORF type:complete len:126 (-),score=13.02 GHVO01020781.1:20-397(-)